MHTRPSRAYIRGELLGAHVRIQGGLYGEAPNNGWQAEGGGGPVSLQLDHDRQKKLAEVTQHHGIRLLLAFGSQVNGCTHSGSDLDLAVLLEDARRSDWMELAADLQRLFPGQEVDVVWLHRADPLLGWQVCRDAHLLLGEPNEFTRYRTYAWRRFVEYRSFFELEEAAVHHGIQRFRDASR